MDVNDFVADQDVRLTWIAFFILWVLWGFVYFVRHVFGENTEKPAPAQDSEQQASESKPPPTKTIWTPEGALGSRLANAHRVLFENTLLLLGILVVNTFGGGSTRAVMILTWIFLGLTVIMAVTEVGYGHRFVRFLFSATFFGITLAIGGLAFQQGWQQRH